jgi:hypothetical protein
MNDNLFRTQKNQSSARSIVLSILLFGSFCVCSLHSIRAETRFSHLRRADSSFANAGVQDAIGKCHESLTVAEILTRYPKAVEVDSGRHRKISEKYQGIVKRRGLEGKLIRCASRTVDAMLDYISVHMSVTVGELEISKVQLASEAYRTDPLNTTDVRVWAAGRTTSTAAMQQFDFSLKALGTKEKSPDIKNPGLGKFFSAEYFNCGDIQRVAREVKEKFHSGELDYDPIYRSHPGTTNRHANALVLVAEEIFRQLSQAPDSCLIHGIHRLVGTAPWIIAAYETDTARWQDVPKVEPPFVIAQTPTPINVTIAWSNYMIILRVKFVSGTSKEYLNRWSSLKLLVKLERI